MGSDSLETSSNAEAEHPHLTLAIFGHYAYDDGMDIFTDLYLRKRGDAKDVDFGRKHRNLEDAMARAKKIYNEHIIEDREDDDESN